MNTQEITNKIIQNDMSFLRIVQAYQPSMSF